MILLTTYKIVLYFLWIFLPNIRGVKYNWKKFVNYSRLTPYEYELHENFSKHIGKLVCRHGAKPCNKETELLGTLKASMTTT